MLRKSEVWNWLTSAVLPTWDSPIRHTRNLGPETKQLLSSCCPADAQLLPSCHLRSDAGVVPPSMSAQLVREAAGECLEAAHGDSEEPVWLAARDIDLEHAVSTEWS